MPVNPYFKIITEGSTDVEVTNKLYSDDYYVYTTTAANSYTGTVNIPATIVYEDVTYTVTRVGRGAFYGSTGLISVTLPVGIQVIEAYAFNGCSSLETVALPATGFTTIGTNVFNGCSKLETLHLPASLTSINRDNATFLGCSILSFTAAAGGAFSVSDGVLYERGTDDDSGNARYYIRWIPETKTGEYAIPDGVVRITRFAIYGNKLTKISVPASVTFIGQTNFENCTLLTDIVLNWADPNVCTTNYVTVSFKSNITLHVPVGSVALYAGHEVWGSGFKEIKEQ